MNDFKGFDYTIYKALGGELEQDLFNKFLPVAVGYIDYLTLGKIIEAVLTDINQTRLNNCLMSLIDTLNENDLSKKSLVKNADKKSESVASHSVAYNNGSLSGMLKDIDKVYYDIAYKFLLPTGLLYSGVKVRV